MRRASYQAISDLPRPNPLGEFFINPKKIAAALGALSSMRNWGFNVLRAFRHSAYDVVVDDISLIDNYRSQFHRMIARSSFKDLLRIMKEKQSGYSAGDR